MSNRRLYVLIRNDLADAYKAVQAGHAVAQFLIEQGSQNESWRNEYLIYVIVPGIEDLHKWAMKVERRGLVHSCFFEPDLNNEMTALAVSDPSGRVFSSLRLLGAG